MQNRKATRTKTVSNPLWKKAKQALKEAFNPHGLYYPSDKVARELEKMGYKIEYWSTPSIDGTGVTVCTIQKNGYPVRSDDDLNKMYRRDYKRAVTLAEPQRFVA